MNTVQVARVQYCLSDTLGSKIIPVSVSMEQKIFPMPEEERQKFLEEAKTKSKLSQIIQSGFESIQLVNFFTVGPDEVRGKFLFLPSSLNN